MTDSELIQKAKQFATHAHRDHFRNDAAKTPYVLHLQEVAELVEKSGGSEVEIAAAWLHDTVEDTQTTIEDIQREFGPEVTAIVRELTDKEEWLALPLQERKAEQAKHAAQENQSVKRVKLADQTSNVRIVGSGKLDFKKSTHLIYIDGAKGIAEACKGVNPYLDTLFLERYEEARKNLTA